MFKPKLHTEEDLHAYALVVAKVATGYCIARTKARAPHSYNDNPVLPYTEAATLMFQAANTLVREIKANRKDEFWALATMSLTQTEGEIREEAAACFGNKTKETELLLRGLMLLVDAKGVTDSASVYRTMAVTAGIIESQITGRSTLVDKLGEST